MRLIRCNLSNDWPWLKAVPCSNRSHGFSERPHRRVVAAVQAGSTMNRSGASNSNLCSTAASLQLFTGLKIPVWS